MEKAVYESPIIDKIMGIRPDHPRNPKQPIVLTLVGYSGGAPCDLRLTQSAAKELMGVLSTHPLVGRFP